jgi:hypothetical protein
MKLAGHVALIRETRNAYNILEVLIATSLKIAVFWDVVLCNVIDIDDVVLLDCDAV